MPHAIVNARIHPMPGIAGDAASWRSRRTPAGPPPWEVQAEGMVWDGDTVLLVGSDAEVRGECRRRGIEPEDMAGRLVVPGFVDAHTHFLHIGVKRLRPDLSACASRQEALEVAARWLASHPGREPVIAERWDESRWPEPSWPTRAELDGLAPQRPLVMRRICGHIAVANSPAVALVAGHWAKPGLVDPATGVLLEEASLYLNEVIPAGAAMLEEALGVATAACHRLGITTVGDYEQAPLRRFLLEQAAAGRLRVRVACSIYPQQLAAEAAGGFRTGRRHGPFLRDGGLKVFLDGSLGARTAALREAYEDGAGHAHPQGKLNHEDAEVAGLFAAARQAGIQVHAHAIGDAAVDQGLRAFAAQEGSRELRDRFEHFEIVHDGQVAQAVRLGLVASCQPNFVGTWSGKGGMYEARLGPRYRLGNRFRSYTKAGLPLAFGSDGMPPGPLEGIAAAVAHPEASQRMAPLEAVWHYTWAAAWACHWDDEVGSLEAGKKADFVVLDGSAPWSVHRTVVAGRTVHQA